MAKLILGTAPKTITREVTFPLLDGSTGSIKAEFTYRSRSAFAAWMDGMIGAIKTEGEAELAAAKAKADAAKADPAPDAPQTIDLGISEAEITAKKSRSQADFLMGALTGWNLDAPFDRQTVEQLIDEVPIAASTLIAAYREAMTEGRLGN